jgi:hypothetical protein
MTRALAFGFALLAGGCAADTGTYPSLAPRLVERLGFEEPDPAAPQAAAPDTALDQAVARASEALNSARSDFDAAAATAERAAARARGAAAGSEPWIEAQTALAQLDIVRAATSAAVSDLEQLAIERATTLAPPYPALVEAQARAQAALREQDATIRRLTASLAPA